MNKQLSVISLGLTTLFVVSCSPYMFPAPPPQQPVEVNPVAPKPTYNNTRSTPTNQTVTSATQKAQRKVESMPPAPSTTPSISAPKPPATKQVPVAAAIPGKPGWVYNPYNNNPVLVQGIASGKKVRDPKDPNEDHIFRVP